MTGDAQRAEDLDRLAEAFVEQARRGASPSVEAVANAHPELAADIRELFPVLALVEGLKVGESVRERRAPALPGRIGDYAIDHEIGRGGMGVVYEGRRVGDGDAPALVAMKVVHAHLLERPAYVARFLQEAAAGRSVRHPNVVRTLETGVVDVGDAEVPYILLEHVEGQNLRSLLREVEVVPERLCRHVGLRLADALAAVHAAGLVHRDVKPENVVITKEETVKLMDLGVAVVQDRLQRISRTGEFVGSLLYAAPGQVAGDDPDPRWDLHALGILLYELATGQHPARSAGLRWLRANEAARNTLTRQDALAHLSPFFAAVIEDLLATEDDGSLGSAAVLRDVLSEGETSAWWSARRAAATTPASRLLRIARTTAFYGRESEWKTLDRAYAEACEGHGRAVLIEGEAGIGKSRLLYEWTAAQRGTQSAPRVVLLSHAPGGAGGDEAQLAAGLAQILGEEDLEDRLAGLLGTRARLVPGLLRRLRAEPGRQESISYDAGWMSLLQALAGERPVLLVAEDLHFASDEDVDRFLFLARGATAPGLLVVGTFRPDPEREGIRELALRTHVTHLTLGGLDTEACRQLLFEASADTPRLGEGVESLAERSDRNPMFLLELVRRAQERAGAEVSGETTVPDSIRGFLEARIAALEPEDRELLQVASCQGYEFDPVVVAVVSGTGRVHALKRYGRLERGHGLLQAAGRRYRFQHHLVQEVLYTELHPALRESWHAALGSVLEAGMEAPRGADTVTLCTHFLRGNQPLRARPHLREAMDYLEWQTTAYVASEELARRALAVEGLIADADRALALHICGRADVGAGRGDQAEAALEESLRLARETGENVLEVDCLKMLSWLARMRDRPEESVRHLELAAARAHEAGAAGQEAAALSVLGIRLMNQGRYDEADAMSERAFAALGTTDDPHVRNRLISNLASIRIHQGRQDEAQELLEASQRLAHEIGDVATELLNADGLGRLAFQRGRFEEAAIHIRTALERGHSLGVHHSDAFHLMNLGRCHAKLGRHDDAFHCLTESKALAERGESRLLVAMVGVELGTALAARGALGDALEEISASRSAATGTPREDILLLASAEEARVLTLLGRFEEAGRALDDAEAAWSGRGSPALGIHLTAARAQLLEAEGRHAQAATLYAEAAQRADRASRVSTPYAFYRARALRQAGGPTEDEDGARRALVWARESGIPALALRAQIHLAGCPDGDLLGARLALEQHADRLSVEEQIQAHFALWEADGETASLEAAWRELRRLQLGAPAEDRERMLARVDLHRRIAAAWTEHGG